MDHKILDYQQCEKKNHLNSLLLLFPILVFALPHVVGNKLNQLSVMEKNTRSTQKIVEITHFEFL